MSSAQFNRGTFEVEKQWKEYAFLRDTKSDEWGFTSASYQTETEIHKKDPSVGYWKRQSNPMLTSSTDSGDPTKALQCSSDVH